MVLVSALHLLVLGAAVGVSATDSTTREPWGPYNASVASPDVSFDCKNVKADNYLFDLSPIKFPIQIESSESTPPTTTKTVIAIDLCAPLPSSNGAPDEQCSKGARICMKVNNIKNGNERVTQVITAAGGGGEKSENEWTVSLGEHLDSAERALEWEMQGAYYGEHRQRSEIEFKCDKQAAKDTLPTLKKYDRLEGKLKLEWRTPYACATHMGGAGDDNRSDGDKHDGSGKDEGSKGGWGLFSWFFFLVIMGTVVYLAAGLWRNYNEYGVIELPNKDFWREAPYIAKDMGRHIYSTVSGQGASRGAYEPV